MNAILTIEIDLDLEPYGPDGAWESLKDDEIIECLELDWESIFENGKKKWEIRE